MQSEISRKQFSCIVIFYKYCKVKTPKNLLFKFWALGHIWFWCQIFFALEEKHDLLYLFKFFKSLQKFTSNRCLPFSKWVGLKNGLVTCINLPYLNSHIIICYAPLISHMARTSASLVKVNSTDKKQKVWPRQPCCTV